MARRVESLRAEKVASRLVEYLTIRLCIIPDEGACQEVARFFDLGEFFPRDLLRTKGFLRAAPYKRQSLVLCTFPQDSGERGGVNVETIRYYQRRDCCTNLRSLQE